MARSHWHPRACKVCGVTNEKAHISQKGHCKNCWLARQEANVSQLEAGAGELYEHWLYRCALAVRRQIVALETSQAPAQGVQSEP